MESVNKQLPKDSIQNQLNTQQKIDQDKENDFYKSAYKNYYSNINQNIFHLDAKTRNKILANTTHLFGNQQTNLNQDFENKFIKNQKQLLQKQMLLEQIQQKKENEKLMKQRKIEEEKQWLIKMERQKLKEEIRKQQETDMQQQILNKHQQKMDQSQQQYQQQINNESQKKVTFKEYKNQTLDTKKSEQIENQQHKLNTEPQIFKSQQIYQDPLYTEELALKIQKKIIENIDSKISEFQKELDRSTEQMRKEILNIKNLTLDIQYQKNEADNEIKKLRNQILEFQYDDQVRTRELTEALKEDNIFKILPNETFYRQSDGNFQNQDFSNQQYCYLNDRYINNKSNNLQSNNSFVPLQNFKNIYQVQTNLIRDESLDQLENYNYQNIQDNIKNDFNQFFNLFN